MIQSASGLGSGSGSVDGSWPPDIGIEPYYQDDWRVIYHGDCREVLPQLPKVDLVATSPPYNCRIGYDGFKDEVPWPEYYSLLETVIAQCYQLLLLGGTIAVNVPPVIRWQRDHEFANTWSGFDPEYKTHRVAEKVLGKGRIEPIGFRVFSMMEQNDTHLREPIAWVKGSEGNAISTTYAMGCDSDPYMRPCHEWILLGSKGRWFHRGGTGRRGKKAVPFMDETKDVWFVSPNSDRNHPAVFPVEIPSRLIRLFTHSRDAIVLDPFMGRGATLIAAGDLGRKAIGIEIGEKYCEIAANRCAADVVARIQRGEY